MSSYTEIRPATPGTDTSDWSNSPSSSCKYLSNSAPEVKLSGCGWFAHLSTARKHKKTRTDYIIDIFRSKKVAPIEKEPHRASYKVTPLLS